MNRIKTSLATLKGGFFYCKNRIALIGFLVFAAMFVAMPVAAAGLEGTSLVTGLKKLMNDATSVLLVLAPIVGICVSAYFLIRRGASDEMDQKKWENRIKVALVSMIGVVVLSATVKAILSYFS